MLEWNMFVKPVIYVIELIFGAVVTLGTADKLLMQCPGRAPSWRLCCALDLRRNPLGSCIAVILVGAATLLLLLYVLWRRLVAAFDSDELFAHGTEAQLCAATAVLWLVVACVLTSASRMRTGSDTRGEEIVSVVFSWLLVCLCFGSAAVAWLVPDNDDVDAHYVLCSEEPPGAVEVEPPRPAVEPPPASAPPPPLRHQDAQQPPMATHAATVSIPEDMSLALSSEGSELKRSDAARISSDQPDTEFINRKLTDWERLIDGPPSPDAHANALASARRMPVAALPPNPIAQGGSSSLRRRLAVVQPSEDEITPDIAKMQQQSRSAKTD